MGEQLKPGDIRIINGKRSRFVEHDDRGDVWEILDTPVHSEAPTNTAGETRDGWVLVPREAVSDLMIHFDGRGASMRSCWAGVPPEKALGFIGALRAALAAAPQPEKAGEEAPVAWRVRHKHKDGSWGAWYVTEAQPDPADFMDGYGEEIRELVVRTPSQEAVVSEGLVEAQDIFDTPVHIPGVSSREPTVRYMMVGYYKSHGLSLQRANKVANEVTRILTASFYIPARSDDRTEALMDSQYLAGVSAGWNAANGSDPEAELAALKRSREGQMAAVTERRAAPPPSSAGEA